MTETISRTLGVNMHAPFPAHLASLLIYMYTLLVNI